jgi:hypothetical protein
MLKNNLGFIIFVYFINVVLYFITFSWIVILEKNKCECSNNWKREFIKYFLLIFISYIILSILFQLTNTNSIVFNYIKYILYVAEIVFIIITFIYIQELIKNKCECSKMIQRDITYIYTIVDIIVILLSIFLAICVTIYKTLN